MLYHPKLQHLSDHEKSYLIKEILEHVTKKSLIQIISENYKLTVQEEDQINEILSRHLGNHEPLAYIFGKINFLDFELNIRPPILIPRPETEEWVGEFIYMIKKFMVRYDFSQETQNHSLRQFSGQASRTGSTLSVRPECSTELQRSRMYRRVTFADIGTGSGCIAIALAKNFPNSRVYAVDISETALELAKENAKKNNVQNIIFLKSDMLSDIDQVDFILSNPPYIPESEYHNLDPSVKNWEDKNALVAQQNGLEFIERLLTDGPKKLTKNPDFDDLPRILIEIGYNQAKIIKEKFPNIEIKKDSWGKERITVLHMPKSHL